MPDGYSPSATSDQGANVRKALEDLCGYDWIPCLAHITHLSVGGALDAMGPAAADLTKSCNDIAVHFRVSPKQTDAFRQVQIQVQRELMSSTDGQDVDTNAFIDEDIVSDDEL